MIIELTHLQCGGYCGEYLIEYGSLYDTFSTPAIHAQHPDSRVNLWHISEKWCQGEVVSRRSMVISGKLEEW